LAEQCNGAFGHVYFVHQPFYGPSPKQYDWLPVWILLVFLGDVLLQYN